MCCSGTRTVGLPTAIDANAGVHLHVGDVVAKYLCSAVRRKKQAHQYLDRRRFSGAVSAEKAENLTAFHIERQAIEGKSLFLSPKAGLVLF